MGGRLLENPGCEQPVRSETHRISVGKPCTVEESEVLDSDFLYFLLDASRCSRIGEIFCRSGGF